MSNSSTCGLYSARSRSHLGAKASALTTAIDKHTAALLAMPTESPDRSRLAELNEVVRCAVAAWDNAVFIYTGTFPVAVDFDEDEDEDEAMSFERSR
jgi:hypothetical protein